MPITDAQRDLLALARIKQLNWYLLAREAQRADGLERLLDGQVTEHSRDAEAARQALKEGLGQLESHRADVEALVAKATAAGARLATVVDDDYPATLRLIYNLPPFLFVQGSMLMDDLRSVAVVGTRAASEDGKRRAANMARLLVERRVTVVSGLARGIDTAAHSAALEAQGRTIAVIGTGILKCYPAENRDLAARIAEHGAVVSQFWPDAGGASYTFPRRNVTMSGIAQGTVVIEAGATSGAKMQARIALEHGKKVFLIRSLTESQEWARRYVEERGAIAVEDVDAVATALSPVERIRADDERRVQLALNI
jgi:DNA processing protein